MESAVGDVAARWWLVKLQMQSDIAVIFAHETASLNAVKWKKKKFSTSNSRPHMLNIGRFHFLYSPYCV